MKYYISHSVRVERTCDGGFCRCEFFQDRPWLPQWWNRDPAVAVFTYFDYNGSFVRVSPLVMGTSLESDVSSDVLRFSSHAAERRRPHNIGIKLRTS